MMVSATETVTMPKSKMFHTQSLPRQNSSQPSASSFRAVSPTKMKTVMLFSQPNQPGMSSSHVSLLEGGRWL